MPEAYPWYELVEGSQLLAQGDLIPQCPILSPLGHVADAEEGATLDAGLMTYDVVVMSQSCDLRYKKVDLVLVCPYWSLAEFAHKNPYYRSAEGKESIRRGFAPGYHMLNKCEIEGYRTDLLVVDFRTVYGCRYQFLTDLAEKGGRRVRLLPPYREHLSQAFARFFMRVGLPATIPEFK